MTLIPHVSAVPTVPNVSKNTVCFIAMHSGPADHFAAFAEKGLMGRDVSSSLRAKPRRNSKIGI